MRYFHIVMWRNLRNFCSKKVGEGDVISRKNTTVMYRPKNKNKRNSGCAFCAKPMSLTQQYGSYKLRLRLLILYWGTSDILLAVEIQYLSTRKRPSERWTLITWWGAPFFLFLSVPPNLMGKPLPEAKTWFWSQFSALSFYMPRCRYKADRNIYDGFAVCPQDLGESPPWTIFCGQTRKCFL